MATYGEFPGVRVDTQSGGISSVAIGAEEKLVIFGEANYDASNNVEGDDTSLSISASEPEQIRAPRVADDKFGSDSELADAMKEALSNGANVDYLYGVAVPRVDVTGESFNGSSGSSGTLDNVEILENTDEITTDSGVYEIEFRYDGAPSAPTGENELYINPLTGQYQVTSGTVTSAGSTIDYTYNDYSTAFAASGPRNVVAEDETGVWVALSDSDSVSNSMNVQVSELRSDYQLVHALTPAEPNDNELLDSVDATNGGADARYDFSGSDTYKNGTNANQSISESYFYKFAPARKEDKRATIGGGIGGLFAGNPIQDPIYNEALSGYQALEQQLSRSESDNARSDNLIPVRSGGAVRVQGNRSTDYDNSVAADFWTRRITDRVILIGKQIGDEIIGRINDPQTRAETERAIRRQMRSLAANRLIRQNTSNETNWTVEVYEDENNDDEVNIDISFSPYGIVKRVDESITVNTN